MKLFTRVMKALSDSNRVKIVKILQQKGMCVCELQASLKITQPSVSKHLKILEDAGLVASSKDGIWVNYRLSNGDTNPYVTCLLTNLRQWLNDDPDVESLIKCLPLIDRESICRKQAPAVNSIRTLGSTNDNTIHKDETPARG
ncbi:MAG: winged helix-turn-helix transcriptional regulator [Deltaproteobacteria bacterium]|nr:winged helix-turn-helix transcriptional regulator [Deltaproteobacteria bacterium]